MQAVVGVDPHKRVFSAVALDSRGGRLGKWTGGTTCQAIVELQTWASEYASGAVWAIESTNSWGRRLAMALAEAGADVRGGRASAGRVPAATCVGDAAPARSMDLGLPLEVCPNVAVPTRSTRAAHRSLPAGSPADPRSVSGAQVQESAGRALCAVRCRPENKPSQNPRAGFP
jgi:hypothetical protein